MFDSSATAPQQLAPPSAASSWPRALLAGGSVNGRRLHERDWSTTAMGPIETWPQSLRTTLLTCLESRFPTFVYWGEELIQFYNDAGTKVVGAKDKTSAFGGPIRESFPELWPLIGPMFQTVLTSGQATWAEDQLLWMERSGFVEETYLTWSYSPLRVESGEVGGIFCSVIEVTRQVVGERRLRLLREMATRCASKTSVEEACRECMAVLGDNHPDLAFGVLRLRIPGTDSVKVVGSFGVVVPERSQTLPIVLSGENAGSLSLGLNPNRPFDDDYKSFVNLVAVQLSAALGNARSHEAARARTEELAQLDRAKSAFFSNVSHEFRTPLTLLLGPLEAALSEADGGCVTLSRESVALAHRNATRLQKLVNSLLDFARVEGGRMGAAFEAVDLAAYTAELASQFRSVMEGGGLRFVVDAQPLSRPVFVDCEMWEKILLNLLSNAFKFTFEGDVTVSLREEAADAVLDVRDTGGGVPEHELPRVFDRFHRIAATRSRSFEGSGIGLALVHELVRLHGGSVSAQSEVGKGSTFTVRIPMDRRVPDVAPPHAADEVSPRSEAEARNEARQWPQAPRTVSPRSDAYVIEARQWLQAPRTLSPPVHLKLPLVLVVDDNADMRAYIRGLLSAEYAVEVAEDGRAALELMAKRTPELIVADVMMPELDGFELLAEVRRREETKLTPFILLSARAGEEATVGGLQAGADDYLVKPFSPKELRARVATNLKMAALRRDLDAEKKARLAREEIRKLSMLLDASPDHVFLLDRELRFVYVNRSAEESVGAHLANIGRAGEPVLHQSPRQMAFAPDFLEQFEADIGSAFRGETVVGTVVFPSPLGPRHFEYILSRLPGAAGEAENVLGITRDIQELKAAVKMRDDFLSVASHELKTPITSLSLQNQLRMRMLRSQTDITPEKLMKMFGDDARQLHRLLRLVDDMLDSSRLEGSLYQLKRDDVELNRLVQDVTDRMAPELSTAGAEITVARSDGELWGRWDRYRLEQVMGNLLTNAMKYGDGKPVTITVRALPDLAEVRITDRGVGIAAEDQARVFDRFERGVNDRGVTGLGLGLFIVRQIVEAHGGRVRVESEPNKGSTFTVELPRQLSSDHTAAAAAVAIAAAPNAT